MKKTQWLKCVRCGQLFETELACSCGPDCLPVCCGAPMVVLTEKTDDTGKEKHVPVPEAGDTQWTMKVKVGAVPHPMTEEHYIAWIEITDGDLTMRRDLHPGETPEAVFPAVLKPGMIIREYCTLHGVWTYTVKD